jgi:hypothetical protein
MKKRHVFAVLVLSVLVLSSCAKQPVSTGNDLPGILMGLVHGSILLFSLVGSIFWDIRVYAYPNSGFWYDFGFVLGAACFFGGAGGRSARV